MTQWQIGHTQAPGGGQILGLGGGKTETRLQTVFEVLPVGQDQYCVIMHEAHGTFVTSPEVHVASNFEQGSCEYSEVLLHEQKHIKALRDFHLKHEKNMRKQLKKIARTVPKIEPVPKGGIEAAQSGLNTYVQSELDRYFKRIVQELLEKQKEIDSPEEYARVASKCRKWTQKLSEE